MSFACLINIQCRCDDGDDVIYIYFTEKKEIKSAAARGCQPLNITGMDSLFLDFINVSMPVNHLQPE